MRRLIKSLYILFILALLTACGNYQENGGYETSDPVDTETSTKEQTEGGDVTTEESGSQESSSDQTDTQPTSDEQTDAEDVNNEESGSQESSGQVGDEDSMTEQQTEEPETFDLPEGESAASGAAVNSGVTEENIEYTMYNFLEDVLLDVDAFWSDIIVQAGYVEPFVYYHFPGPGESVYSACEGYTGELEFFYCSADDTIVFTQALAEQLWLGTFRTNAQSNVPYNAGDFSVATLVAHEFAHSLQAELGWFPNGVRAASSRSIELNADCLSGVWANSVYARGLLEQGDIEESMRTLSDIGNDIDNNALSHGLPHERTEAFMLGYNSGSAQSCDEYLFNEY